MNSKVELAFFYASSYHQDQRYGNEPYINHPLRVRNLVLKFDLSEEYEIVALLHDTIEDTDIEEKLISESFGDSVLDAVKAMTHFKALVTYEVYMSKLMENPIAKRVKFFDVMDNLKHSILDESEWKIDKYTRGLYQLIGE